jgi:hypothetical protein
MTYFEITDRVRAIFLSLIADCDLPDKFLEDNPYISAWATRPRTPGTAALEIAAPSPRGRRLRLHGHVWNGAVLTYMFKQQRIPGNPTKAVALADSNKTAVDDGPNNPAKPESRPR